MFLVYCVGILKYPDSYRDATQHKPNQGFEPGAKIKNPAFQRDL